jgi:hypothetical protein
MIFADPVAAFLRPISAQLELDGELTLPTCGPTPPRTGRGGLSV